MATLENALRQFELVEANLAKLEQLWEKIEGLLPNGPAFGSPPGYDESCIAFERILSELPAIDGFRVEHRLYEYDEAGHMRLDALELGEFEVQVSTDRTLTEQGRLLREYRIRFQAKRRELIRARLVSRMEVISRVLEQVPSSKASNQVDPVLSVPDWERLKSAADEIETLLGGDPRPEAWYFLRDAIDNRASVGVTELTEGVWPKVFASLNAGLYGEFDPAPVAAEDLAEIVSEHPEGAVSHGLNWSRLSEQEFERLLFQLISEADEYENPKWLQKTHAPDRGRDLSADRVAVDSLSGVIRSRTIIQCKHRLSKSVGADEVGRVRDAMGHWEPPRVDVLVIATSGRFTADAVKMVEKHNQSDRGLHIDIWPDSHLERLLAERPHLIGSFGLRESN